VEFGLLPPYREGVAADPEWMRGFAGAADRLGFESIYAVEHLLDEHRIPDPIDLLAYLAGVTDRIVLATGVLVLPLHAPVPLAKRLTTLDVLSGGRLRLGVGVGRRREEFEVAGVDFTTRGARTDEMIQALRVIWAADVASFNGRHVAFDGVVSRPRTVRPAGIPIHVGGRSEAAAVRAGRLGDGFQPLDLDDETLTERLRTLWETAVESGRDPDSIELTLSGRLDEVDDAAIASAERFGAARLVLSTRERRLDDAVAQLERFARQYVDAR